MCCSISNIVFLGTAMLAVSLSTQVRAESRMIELPTSQVYTNGPSQFRFPPTIATFQRESKVSQYDSEGRDVGVGYNDLLHNVAATAFVYPVGQRPPNDKLDGHFGTCKAEVFKRHPNAKLLYEGKIQIIPDGHKQDGLHANFAFTDIFAHRRQPVGSELYLFVHRHTFVLFRITYPTGQETATEPTVKAFIDGLDWP